MVNLLIDVAALAFGIFMAVSIWRSAFVRQNLSRREAIIGAPASILCALLTIYMGLAKNPSVLPIVLILWVLAMYIVLKGLRAAYNREKERHGWPWPHRIFPPKT